MSKTLTGLDSVLTHINGELLLEPAPACPRCGFQAEPVKPPDAKGLLLNILERRVSQEPIRTIDVGLRLHRSDGKTLELDNDDITLLNNAVTDDRFASDLIKGFLLRLIDGEAAAPTPSGAQ